MQKITITNQTFTFTKVVKMFCCSQHVRLNGFQLIFFVRVVEAKSKLCLC